MGFQTPPKKIFKKKTWLLNNKQKSPLLTHRLKMTTCLLFEEGGCQSSVNSSMTCGEQRGSATLQDLDEFEIGGLLSWKDPVDFSEVTHYNVTWVGPKWVGLVVGLGWVGLGWLLQTQITSHLTWFPGSYWIMQYPMNLYM